MQKFVSKKKLEAVPGAPGSRHTPFKTADTPLRERHFWNSIRHDGTQAIARMQRLHGFKGALDALEPMRNVLVEREMALLVILDERRHLRAALPATECRPGPSTSCDELEWPGA